MKAMIIAAVAVAFAASSCTYELRDDGVSASCDPLEFVINSHGVGLGQSQHDAIVDAVEDFGAMVGRQVDYLGGSTITYLDHEQGDPILIELTWPDDAPNFLGFANPYIHDGVYDGGWLYFNPAIKSAPAAMVKRLVMHELGHLAGLGDVFDDTTELMNPNLTSQDWGTGDLSGFIVTHGGGCENSTLVGDLVAEATAEANGQTAMIDTQFAAWLESEDIELDLDAHIHAHNHNDHDDHDHDGGCCNCAPPQPC